MLEGVLGTAQNEAAPSPPRWAMSLAGDPREAREVELHGLDRACVVETATGSGASLVSVRLAQARHLAADDLQRSVSAMYLAVLRALRRTDSPHPVRMWSFIPGIHDAMEGGLDRYRVFNMGRFDALCEWFGGPDTFPDTLPAASAVGHSGDALSIHALGVPAPGSPIENPRQRSAFCYSREYGPRPPCFARAMVAQLPIGTRLLVAGTASILGERSVHPGCLATQFRESLENISALAASVRCEHRFDLSGVETARVYCARATDLPLLAQWLPERLPQGASVEYTVADICRSELLVEIEVTVAPSASRQRPA